MNAYNLSRMWFDFAFDNPEQIKPAHCALYFFAIEHCNRLGWKKKFGLPSSMAMEAIGIKSYNTYKSTLADLVEWGFVEMVQKSKNQYSSNIIALSFFDKAFDKANNKALDKALLKHTTKQSESTVQSTVQSIVSIDKQYNKEQLNQLTNKPITTENEASTYVLVDEKKNNGNSDLNLPVQLEAGGDKDEAATKNKVVEIQVWPTFEDFWELYDKKRGSIDKIRTKWDRLKQKDKEEIMAYIPNYIQAQPDKQFRKDPSTFLNNKSWQDEIITKQVSAGTLSKSNSKLFQRLHAKAHGVNQPG